MGNHWCLHTVESLQEGAAADNQIKQLTAKTSGLKWFIKYSFIDHVLQNTIVLGLSAIPWNIHPEAQWSFPSCTR